MFELLSQGVGKLYSSIHLKKTHRQNQGLAPAYTVCVTKVERDRVSISALIPVQKKGQDSRFNTMNRVES